jgi:putative membrane protein
MTVLALLHEGTQIGLGAWTIHWSTVVGLAALGALYLWRARAGETERNTTLATPINAGERRRTPTRAQHLSFFAGLVVIFVSLNGPIHDLSDYYLFSAHMVQHLLLTLVAPPLLLAGVPGWMLRPALALRGIAPLARRVTRVGAAYLIFNLVVAAWHLPPVYNTAMANHGVHIAQHLMFMAAAVLMWWPLMSPLPELPRIAYPAQMLYCFLMTIPMSIVSIYITMADSVLYPAYAAAPRTWGLSPMEDQLIGGLIMWIPGGLFFLGVMSVVFFKWSARGEDHAAGAQIDWRPGLPAPGKV